MNFNKHYDLEGKHATFTASGPSWLNYDDETLVERYLNSFSDKIGTILHAYAHDCIRYNVKLSNTAGSRKATILELLRNDIPDYAVDENKWFLTLKEFIDDAIGYRMTSEQTLLYSKRFFGTADAISFNHNQLRIHDLKTGTGKPNPDQLKVYASLFCLEYDIKPETLDDVILKFYHCSDVEDVPVDKEELVAITNKIVTFDKRIELLSQTGGI